MLANFISKSSRILCAVVAGLALVLYTVHLFAPAAAVGAQPAQGVPPLRLRQPPLPTKHLKDEQGDALDVPRAVPDALWHDAAFVLIELTPDQRLEQQRPLVQLAPLGGGGLFKQVQAPQRTGVQAWAVMLVHPDGVVTATKQVRVVDTDGKITRY